MVYYCCVIKVSKVGFNDFVLKSFKVRIQLLKIVIKTRNMIINFSYIKCWIFIFTLRKC